MPAGHLFRLRSMIKRWFERAPQRRRARELEMKLEAASIRFWSASCGADMQFHISLVVSKSFTAT